MPKTHVLVPRRAKHHIPAFSFDKDCEVDLWIFEEWNKNILSFADNIFFAPNEGFYCWIAGGGVQNIWPMFKFIILSLVN